MKPTSHLFNFLAFLGVLIAIVVLALFGGQTDIAILTGLVGVLGSFRPWSAHPEKPSDEPDA